MEPTQLPEAPKWVRFSSQRFENIEAQAKIKWQANVLGPRPDRKSIRAELPSENRISLLQWLAIILLVTLFVFTTLKVSISSGPFAADLTKHIVNDSFYVSAEVLGFLVATTMVLSSMIATPGLIYFQLLRDEPEIRRQQSLHPLFRLKTRSVTVDAFYNSTTGEYVTPDAYAKLTEEEKTLYTAATQRQDKTYREWNVGLDSLSPRLPVIIVWGITIWLFWLSNVGGGNPFLQNLPVIIEVGLAHLVGNIIAKQQIQERVVVQALKAKTEPWDRALAEYRTQPTYNSALYNKMRDEAPKITSKGLTNAALEHAPHEVMDAFLKSEYKRLTSNDDFAKWVIAEREANERALVALGEIAAPVAGALRAPTNDIDWTAETLFNDLLAWGAPASFNRTSIGQHYAPDYKAAEAWRTGAMDKFRAHHSIK